MYHQFHGVPDRSSTISGGDNDLVIMADYNDPTKMYSHQERNFNMAIKRTTIEDKPPKFAGTGLVSFSAKGRSRRTLKGTDKEMLILEPTMFKYDGPREDIVGVLDPMCLFERIFPRKRNNPIFYPEAYFRDFVIIAKHTKKQIVAEITIHDMNSVTVLNEKSQFHKEERAHMRSTFYGGKIF